MIQKSFRLLQEIQKIKLDDTERLAKARDSLLKGQFDSIYGKGFESGPIWEKICQRNPDTKKCLELSVHQAFQTQDHQYDETKGLRMSRL